ncbi:kunitz-type serine protease inhibitor bitisilin-3 [Halichoeres trimaculatus]|uniref:kunitz-type serine protease inhibitor bitisilin-3 n=1 Tax=Halichoeres trimaculatus TaxID=147232 RepID=UPI003D9E96DB
MIAEFCLLPEDSGTGSKFIFSLYYDAANSRCTPFFYKGEGGNANRFINERECMRNCSANSEEKYPMDASKACQFKHMVGGCSGTFLRYYYDSYHDKCKKFLWTGCFGNGNRFFSMESCNATCAGIHVDGDELEEDEPDTPIAIICGVLLAVIVVAVFGTVIGLTVKSKKKAAKKKSGGKRGAGSDSPSPEEQRIEMA